MEGWVYLHYAGKTPGTFQPCAHWSGPCPQILAFQRRTSERKKGNLLRRSPAACHTVGGLPAPLTLPRPTLPALSFSLSASPAPRRPHTAPLSGTWTEAAWALLEKPVLPLHKGTDIAHINSPFSLAPLSTEDSQLCDEPSEPWGTPCEGEGEHAKGSGPAREEPGLS